jgi:hypothetical protein
MCGLKQSLKVGYFQYSIELPGFLKRHGMRCLAKQLLLYQL